MTDEFIFDREAELASLRDRLQRRRPLLVYGPSGVGKTLLLHSVLPEYPDFIDCEQSATIQGVFRRVASALYSSGSPAVVASCGRSGEAALRGKSAVAIKGIVIDALRAGRYGLVLDHVRRPSASFAAAVREIITLARTPIVAVARSEHMEDTGFLQPLFPERESRLAIRNFDRGNAEAFARAVVRRTGLSAGNLGELLDRVLQISEGNPGAILAMLEMAGQERYRSNQHVKVSTLHIDFRLHWKPASR